MIIIVHLEIGLSKYSLFYHYFKYLIDDKDLMIQTHYCCAIMGNMCSRNRTVILRVGWTNLYSIQDLGQFGLGVFIWYNMTSHGFC